MSVSLVRKPIFLISQKYQSDLSTAECSPSAVGVEGFLWLVDGYTNSALNFAILYTRGEDQELDFLLEKPG